MIATPFKLTTTESLSSAAITLCLSNLEEKGVSRKMLSEVCSQPQYGFTASACSEPTGVHLVRITDIKTGEIDWGTVPYCECPQVENYQLKRGDILVARSGSIGKSFLVKNTPTSAIFASYMIRFRVTGVQPSFLYWCFQSQQFWQQIMSFSRGSAMKNINGQMLSRLSFPVPSEEIQVAIAKFLDRFSERLKGKTVDLPNLPEPVSNVRRIVARIEELAAKVEEVRRLRREAVGKVEALRVSTLDGLFQNNNWPFQKITEVASVIAGQHIMAGDYNSSGEGIGYLTGPADFGAKVPEIKHWSHIVKSIAVPGDVLLTVKGAGVGKINLAPNENVTIGRQLMAIRPHEKMLLQEFLYFFLKSCFKHFQSIATATTVPGFKKTDVEDLQIPVPLLKEQHRIVESLNDLQTQIDAVKQLQTDTQVALEALLPSILDKAFKGEL
jgi:type I restriction enzyme S subunit